MFYENFEQICKRQGTSPSACTFEIGMSRSAAAGWKRNKTIPKEEELEALADHLGCSVADFFRDDRIPLGGSEDVKDFEVIYSRCVNARQRHMLMNAVYSFEDQVLNAKQDF